jgi:predicted alpha/beta superfamily hydrolase
MLKPTLAISSLLFAITVIAQNTVRLEIKSLPTYHPFNADVYIAGSFNGWNPQDKNFKFSKNENGNYYFDLKLANGSYEYKITRGGWNKVECSGGGADILNRILKVQGDSTVGINIEGWKDYFPSVAVQRKHTAGKNVHIIDTAFLIPQLHRTRRVWVYLPDGYDGLTKRYPVLYMHDGQNVFDEATSYAGEWGVDECLDTMKRKCIVVAIDNGGNKRLNEYCPYDFSLSGIAADYPSNKGEGDQYVDFLVKTLKPFIDKNYRTLKEKNNTFIAGSSMGGLISMYAVLKYPNVFGGAGVFSPAFWVAPKIFDDIKNKGSEVNSRIYFYAGDKENEQMVPDMIKAHNEMMKVSKPVNNFVSTVDSEAMHNEAAWRKHFPHCYLWLIGEEKLYNKN